MVFELNSVLGTYAPSSNQFQGCILMTQILHIFTFVLPDCAKENNLTVIVFLNKLEDFKFKHEYLSRKTDQLRTVKNIIKD